MINKKIKVSFTEYVNKEFAGGFFGFAIAVLLGIMLLTLCTTAITSGVQLTKLYNYSGIKYVTPSEYNLLKDNVKTIPFSIIASDSYGIESIQNDGTVKMRYDIYSFNPVAGYGTPQVHIADGIIMVSIFLPILIGILTGIVFAIKALIKHEIKIKVAPNGANMVHFG
jgi:hypothetical protein